MHISQIYGQVFNIVGLISIGVGILLLGIKGPWMLILLGIGLCVIGQNMKRHSWYIR